MKNKKTIRNLYIIGIVTTYFGIGWILLIIGSIMHGIYLIENGEKTKGWIIILTVGVYGIYGLIELNDTKDKNE